MRGLAELLRGLGGGKARLFRDEAKLTRMELADVADDTARGTVAVALGGVLVMLGGLSLIAGVVMLAGDQWLLSDLYWLAALIMVIAMGAVAAWMAKRG